MNTVSDVKTSVAVIGAGVLGLCTALELSRAGLAVTLFDKDRPALQASFGNAGYLAVEYLDPLGQPVTKRYKQLRHHLGKLIADVGAEDPDNKTWMGIRPILPDSLPVIDQHPRYPQIGMTFGHHHLGVTQAAISAKMLTALMTQGKDSEVWKPFVDAPEAYSVTRF